MWRTHFRDLEATVFVGAAGLRALERDWAELVDSLSNPEFFHLWYWYRAVHAHLESNPDLVFFVCFRRSGKTVAIFPLRQSQDGRVNQVPVRLFTLPCHPHIDLGDAVFAPLPENRHFLDALAFVLDAFAPGGWDCVEFPRAPADASVVYALPFFNRHSVTMAIGKSKFMECADSYEAYVSTRVSSKFRKNVARQEKKCRTLGKVSYVFSETTADAERAFDAFLTVEASGWKGAGGTRSAIRFSPRLVDFYRQFIRDLASDGRARVHLIELDNEAIAGQFTLVAGRTLNLLKIGFREDLHAVAPGSLLLNELLRRTCTPNSRISRVSFVTGASWNDDWGARSMDVFRVCLFNRTARGMAAYLATRARPFVEAGQDRWEKWQRQRQTSTERPDEGKQRTHEHLGD